MEISLEHEQDISEMCVALEKMRICQSPGISAQASVAVFLGAVELLQKHPETVYI